MIVLKWKSSLLSEAMIIEKPKWIFASEKWFFWKRDSIKVIYTELYSVLFNMAYRLKKHLLKDLYFVSVFLLPDLSSLEFHLHKINYDVGKIQWISELHAI